MAIKRQKSDMNATKVSERPRTGRLLAAAALTLVTSSSQARELFLDRIVAVVDNNVVMETELNNRMRGVIQRLNADNTPAPPVDRLRPQILDQLVLERLQLNFAERVGIRVSDEQINQAMQRLAARQNLSLDQFVERVHRQGGSLSELRREFHDQLVQEQINEHVIKRNINISPQDIEHFLNSEEAQLWKSPELQLGHIQLPLSAGASKAQVEAATQQAEQLLQQLAAGADFRQLAVTNSSGPNALQGGDIGWRRAVALPPLLASAVHDLRPGQLSRPVRTDAGLHIFKAYDRRGGVQKMMLQQYNVRHILLTTNALRDDQATRDQLMAIRKRIEDGEEFAELAKEFSDDTGSKQGGGELGWNTVEEGRLVPEFLQTMSSVATGQVSYPFRSQFGWHILQVTETREKDFSEAVTMNQASQILQDRRFDEERAIWLQELRSDAYIELKL